MSERYVVCEGYHDRAFWAGLLSYLNCTDPGKTPAGGRTPIKDPWGIGVTGGQFAFHSKTGQFIRIVQVGGKERVREQAIQRLTLRDQKPVRHLVVTTDLDVEPSGTGSDLPDHSNNLLHMVRGVDAAAFVDTGGDAQLDGGRTVVSWVRWSAPDGPGAGLPGQQTLERLLSAAILAVYPERGEPVETWLESRPAAPLAGPKEYAWSYLAGWYAMQGSYEGFCRAIWDRPDIARELESRLDHAGVWRVAQMLAQ